MHLFLLASSFPLFLSRVLDESLSSEYESSEYIFGSPSWSDLKAKVSEFVLDREQFEGKALSYSTTSLESNFMCFEAAMTKGEKELEVGMVVGMEDHLLQDLARRLMAELRNCEGENDESSAVSQEQESEASLETGFDFNDVEPTFSSDFPAFLFKEFFKKKFYDVWKEAVEHFTKSLTKVFSSPEEEEEFFSTFCDEFVSDPLLVPWASSLLSASYSALPRGEELWNLMDLIHTGVTLSSGAIPDPDSSSSVFSLPPSPSFLLTVFDSLGKGGGVKRVVVATVLALEFAFLAAPPPLLPRIRAEVWRLVGRSGVPSLVKRVARWKGRGEREEDVDRRIVEFLEEKPEKGGENFALKNLVFLMQLLRKEVSSPPDTVTAIASFMGSDLVAFDITEHFSGPLYTKSSKEIAEAYLPEFSHMHQELSNLASSVGASLPPVHPSFLNTLDEEELLESLGVPDSCALHLSLTMRKLWMEFFNEPESLLKHIEVMHLSETRHHHAALLAGEVLEEVRTALQSEEGESRAMAALCSMVSFVVRCTNEGIDADEDILPPLEFIGALYGVGSGLVLPFRLLRLMLVESMDKSLQELGDFLAKDRSAPQVLSFQLETGDVHSKARELEEQFRISHPVNGGEDRDSALLRTALSSTEEPEIFTYALLGNQISRNIKKLVGPPPEEIEEDVLLRGKQQEDLSGVYFFLKMVLGSIETSRDVFSPRSHLFLIDVIRFLALSDPQGLLKLAVAQTARFASLRDIQDMGFPPWSLDGELLTEGQEDAARAITSVMWELGKCARSASMSEEDEDPKPFLLSALSVLALPPGPAGVYFMRGLALDEQMKGLVSSSSLPPAQLAGDVIIRLQSKKLLGGFPGPFSLLPSPFLQALYDATYQGFEDVSTEEGTAVWKEQDEVWDVAI